MAAILIIIVIVEVIYFDCVFDDVYHYNDRRKKR
jgi:hypothetical protein